MCRYISAKRRRWRNAIAVGLRCLLGPAATARTGSVRLLTGTVYEGNITISPLGGLMVNLTGGGTALVPLAFLVSARFDDVGATPATNGINRWVVFRNGSVLPALTVKGAESGFQLEARSVKLKISPLDVAGVVCQPGDIGQWPALLAGRTGVALKNGDFMDGTFRDLDNGQVGLTTVIFGYRKILLDQNVAAIVLHAPLLSAVRYQLRLIDGSVYGSKLLPALAAGDALVIADPVLGEVRVPFNSLVEFKTLPATAR